MKKHCRECPHIIRNKHNDTIVNFAKKWNKPHNCHMTSGVKNLWQVNNKKLQCFGSKIEQNEL